MPSERQSIFQVGASFSRGEDGGLLFTFTSDGSSIIGPRPANEGDKVAHEVAHAHFLASETQAIAEQADADGRAGRLVALEADLAAIQSRNADLVQAVDEAHAARAKLAAEAEAAIAAAHAERDAAQGEAEVARKRADAAEEDLRALKAKHAAPKAAAKPKP